MLPFNLLLPLASVLVLFPGTSVASSASATTSTVSIHIWPVGSATSSPFLTVDYLVDANAPGAGYSASITKQNAGPTIPTSDQFVRLGFYRSDLAALGKQESWVGISVPPSALDAAREKTITLLLDSHGAAWHLGLDSNAPAAQARSAGKKEQSNKVVDQAEGKVQVLLVERQAGPRPVLNKPVVVGADGKVEGEQPTQNFFQKYWWAIALFLLVQAVIGGGGEEKK